MDTVTSAILWLVFGLFHSVKEVRLLVPLCVCVCMCACAFLVCASPCLVCLRVLVFASLTVCVLCASVPVCAYACTYMPCMPPLLAACELTDNLT